MRLSISQSHNGLSRNICLVRERLPFILSRSLVSRIRLPRRVRPRLLLGISAKPFALQDACFQSFLKLLKFLS